MAGMAKLEPNRTSLSSTANPPENLMASRGSIPTTLNETQSSTPVPSRVCCACGAKDLVTKVNTYEPNGEQTEEHSVTIDIRFLKNPSEFTPRMRVQGWRLKKFQGKDAAERFVCRACLIGQREMQHEFKRKTMQELKAQTVGDSYYLAICGE